MLSFLHLSDIHFHKESGTPFDVDADLRNGILNDIKEFSAERPKPDGILVSGDIAYSGLQREYAHAKEWLESICSEVDRDFSYVYCVPGNHDVDQRRVKESELLADVHATLRTVNSSEIDQKLQKYIGDARAKEMLYESIEEYNIFARLLKCDIDCERPIWTKDFVLDDGSKLRLNGLNSAMVSNHLDNMVKAVVLGRYQIPHEVNGTVNVAMCHHPPDWWRDADSVEFDLRQRCRIQLFGHKHSHRLERMGDTVVVAAGAVHPERAEMDWKPRYNWFDVSVKSDSAVRQLNVRVYPRVLHDGKFVADSLTCPNSDHKKYIIDLPPWSRPVLEETPDIPTSNAQLQLGDETMNRGRLLTYRFFELPYVTRLSISQNLGLIRDEDESLRDMELFRMVLRRAKDEGLLATLWDQIEEKHDDDHYTDNPYRT